MPEEQRAPEGLTLSVNKVVEVPAPSVPEVYANHIQVGANSIDFNLQFGTMMNILPAGIVQVARRVDVRISPEVAKMLHLQLTHAIAGYEKQVRSIPQQMQIGPEGAHGQARPTQPTEGAEPPRE
jgi:hypothetical protein